MNAKSKKTLKTAVVVAGLVAVLLPTGCSSMAGGVTAKLAAQGSPDSVVAPHTVD
jgi:predicted phage tail protein